MIGRMAAAWTLLYVFLMLVKEGRGTVFLFAAAISGKASTYALILPSAIAFPIVIALRAEQEKERVSWRHIISQVLSHALSPHTVR